MGKLLDMYKKISCLVKGHVSGFGAEDFPALNGTLMFNIYGFVTGGTHKKVRLEPQDTETCTVPVL